MDKSKENNINVAVSTLLVSYLMKKFSLDTVYYGMIYGLVIQLMMFATSYDYHFDLSFNWYYLLVLPIVGLVSLIIYYLTIYIKKYCEKEYITMTIYDEEKIQLFMKYVTQQKQYYNQAVDINYGNLESQLALMNHRITHGVNTVNLLTADTKLVSQGYDQKIEFKDLYLNVEGHYIWSKTVKEVSDMDKVVKSMAVRYITIKILKTKINIHDLFKKIENYFETTGKIINLKYIKVLKTQNPTYTYNHVVTFYTGIKEPFNTLEEKFMKPFFHQEKDRLWSLIKNVCLNPEFYLSKGQTARASLLLTGPPGTGKSSIVYRIAQCFYRHIISLDLRIASKQQIYQIIQKPTLEDQVVSFKNFIYLFEEFDIAIKELYLREKKSDPEAYYDKMFQSLKDKLIVDIKGPKEEDIEFKLRDLLEIFQGPIPFESMIMIATTNKYDEIKEMIPELFRPGRLTPIHFGYIDQETLQDMSIYFFNKKIKGYLPDILTIPTSQIIELAFEALSTKEPHDYFTTKLHKLMSNI